MKLFGALGTVIAVVLISYAAPHMPVGELFSATWCYPCAIAADSIDRYYPAVEPSVAIIRYETDAPFDEYDPNGLRDRVSTYFSGPYSIPDFIADGTDFGAGAGLARSWLSHLASLAGADAPVDIQFTELTPDSVELTITLDDPSYAGTYELNVILTEDSIHYSAPNGQTIFNQTFRTTMTNSYLGDEITLSESEPVVKRYAVPSDSDWNTFNCSIVAFVQDRSTNEILQGARTRVYRPAYYFALSPSFDIATAVSPDTSASFSATVFNRGTNDDTYNIVVHTELPSGWEVTTTAGGLEFTDSTALAIPGGGSADIGAVLNSNNIRGSGKVVFVISTPNLPGEEDTVTFVLNAGANVLLVDDDEGGPYEQWFMQSLHNLGIIYYYYDHTEYGPPAAALLNQFDAVIWETGTDYSYVIVFNDVLAIQSYLDNGGALYFSSPEIGYFVTEGGGVAYRSFYNNYLKATYEGDNASSRIINGIEGDPIGDGLSFSIEGGDGADDQNYPDYISPQPDAQAFLEYGDGPECAGIHYDGDYKLVYTAFGFEGIASAEARDTLMGRILHWLNPDLYAVKETQSRPNKVVLKASPNPFNSACEITVSGGASVAIYDLKGVRVFSAAPKKSTDVRRIVWRPGPNIASGIYLIKAASPDGEKTSKILYLK